MLAIFCTYLVCAEISKCQSISPEVHYSSTAALLEDGRAGQGVGLLRRLLPLPLLFFLLSLGLLLLFLLPRFILQWVAG